jgi:hypothetical protein
VLDCIRILSIKDWSYLALLDHLLRHTFVPRIRYLGFTTRGKKGPLTTTGDLSACKSKWTLVQLLTVNKPLFWRCCRGTSDQDLIFYCFFVIFSFLLFFLHLLNFDHPQNKSNLVCITLVFLDLFFTFSFLHILFIANPNRRWTTTSPTNPIILWMIRKNFIG